MRQTVLSVRLKKDLSTTPHSEMVAHRQIQTTSGVLLKKNEERDRGAARQYQDTQFTVIQ
jgi:hypothetical protein